MYDFIRDDSFNAPNALSGTTLPMDQQQYGGSLGGPLVRNRTFYFANFEQRLLDQTGLVTILPENVPVINAKLAGDRLSGLTCHDRHLSESGSQRELRSAKLDHQVSGSDQLTLRYSLYHVTSDNSRGAGALNAPTASAGLDNVDHSLAFGNTWTISPKTVNETRAQFAYGDLKAPPTDPIGPAVSIAGVASFGTLSGSPTRRLNTMYQVVNNLSHQAGAHALRAGVDVVFNDDTITYPRSFRGSYAFSSLANFLAGNYSGFTQTFGDPVVSQTNPNVGMYAQDEWRVGVEPDAEPRPSLRPAVPGDRSTPTPTTCRRGSGFAWSPSASQDLVVRGSAGLFFDRVPLRAVANAHPVRGQHDRSRQPAPAERVGHHPDAGRRSGVSEYPAGPPPDDDARRLHDDGQEPAERVLEAGEHRSGARARRGLTVSVGYQYLRGENLLDVGQSERADLRGQRARTTAAGPTPGYRNNSQYSSVAESTYHGLHVSLVQRPTNWASVRVSYTLSKSMNNVGEAFFSSPVDPTDIMRDWGRSDDDQRHRLVINGTVNSSMAPATTTWERISHGFQVSTLLQYYSALPFNITSGVANLQGTNSRPLANGATAAPNFDVRAVTLIPRNAGIGSDFFSLNLRLSRAFPIAGGVKVEGLVEAFNLTEPREPADT